MAHRIARDTGDEVALKVINLEDVYVWVDTQNLMHCMCTGRTTWTT